jgi:hypothetical protein
MTLVFPVISDHYGIINPEYRESYNRTLPVDSVEELIQLLEKGDYNTAISVGAVRKIIFYDQPSIRRFYTALATSNSIDLFEYFNKKVSYDNRLIGVLGIKCTVSDPDIRLRLTQILSDYITGGDYVEEIGRFIADRCFN